MTDEQSPERPVLTVVRGEPSADELAALVAVVAAASAAGSAAHHHPTRSAWSDPLRSVRAPLPRGGWRGSSAPR